MDTDFEIHYTGKANNYPELPMPIITSNPHFVVVKIGSAEIGYLHGEVIVVALPDFVVVPWIGVSGGADEETAAAINDYLEAIDFMGLGQKLVKIDPALLAPVAVLAIQHFATPAHRRPADRQLLMEVLLLIAQHR